MNEDNINRHHLEIRERKKISAPKKINIANFKFRQNHSDIEHHLSFWTNHFNQFLSSLNTTIRLTEKKDSLDFEFFWLCLSKLCDFYHLDFLQYFICCFLNLECLH